MKTTRCLHSYCLFAVAATAATYCGVEGLSSQGHSVDHHHHHHHHQQQQHQPSPQTPPPPITASRRDVFQSTKSAVLGAFCGWILAPKFSLAAGEEESSSSSSLSLVTGRITVPSDYYYDSATNNTKNALYITCRPDRPDNVPQAILDGSRGKAPPVLTARYEHPSFPFEFVLTEHDVTVEGKSSTNNNWWQNDKLMVSARLDTDGIAATRSPEDLVGRGFFLPGSSSVVEIALGGRGAFGKFATKQ